MTELWLPVVGFEGCYEVSDRGRVRSLHRIVKHPREGYERRLKGRMMALQISRTNCGYRTVRLYQDGVGKTFTVHSLVAEAFIGPCPEGQEVLHGAAGVLNNSVENLSYGTHTENMRDKRRDGTEPDRRGELHNNSKLTEKQVLKIRELCSAGVAPKEIAEQFSIHSRHVSNIARRTYWAHI